MNLVNCLKHCQEYLAHLKALNDEHLTIGKPKIIDHHVFYQKPIKDDTKYYKIKNGQIFEIIEADSELPYIYNIFEDEPDYVFAPANLTVEQLTANNWEYGY